MPDYSEMSIAFLQKLRASQELATEFFRLRNDGTTLSRFVRETLGLADALTHDDLAAMEAALAPHIDAGISAAFATGAGSAGHVGMAFVVQSDAPSHVGEGFVVQHDAPSHVGSGFVVQGDAPSHVGSGFVVQNDAPSHVGMAFVVQKSGGKPEAA